MADTPTFSTSCPDCNEKIRIRERSRGKKVRCPFCGKVFVAPPPETVRGEAGLLDTPDPFAPAPQGGKAKGKSRPKPVATTTPPPPPKPAEKPKVISPPPDDEELDLGALPVPQLDDAPAAMIEEIPAVMEPDPGSEPEEPAPKGKGKGDAKEKSKSSKKGVDLVGVLVALIVIAYLALLALVRFELI
jgi:predicted Zn finger-like uncharacterized protein